MMSQKTTYKMDFGLVWALSRTYKLSCRYWRESDEGHGLSLRRNAIRRVVSICPQR